MADLPVPSAPALANLPGVELVQAGQWDISTGLVTFSTDDLAAAVGAVDCPAVRRPILKLGHTDPRFDGEPAVGWVANLALADGGNTVIGDYVGMPGWLGGVIASAYPDRSVEGFFDYRCQLGHTHPFVLTAVALLGITRPGVGTLTSLQDVAALYGVAASTAPAAGHAVSVHCKGVTSMPHPNPIQVAAGVTTEDVRRAYYDTAAWSTWITEMQLDPLQLIVMDDESGSYARVPIVMDGETVTFGPAVPVAITYVDKPAAGTPAAASVLVFASRAESRPNTPQAAATPPSPPAGPAPEPVTSPILAPELPPVTQAAGSVPSNEGASMALDVGLRERLGLGADADEATILAAVDEALTERADPEVIPAPVAEPVAASLPEGTVLVDAERFAQLERQAAEGVAARVQQRTEDRDRTLNAAIKAGKFPPVRKEHYAKAWDADPDGTKQLLASLADGLVPMVDIGEPGREPTGAADDEFDNIFSTPGKGA